jgi:hypothetical protein
MFRMRCVVGMFREEEGPAQGVPVEGVPVEGVPVEGVPAEEARVRHRMRPAAPREGMKNFLVEDE